MYPINQVGYYMQHIQSAILIRDIIFQKGSKEIFLPKDTAILVDLKNMIALVNGLHILIEMDEFELISLPFKYLI